MAETTNTFVDYLLSSDWGGRDDDDAIQITRSFTWTGMASGAPFT